jgi:hypothetical protein
MVGDPISRHLYRKSGSLSGPTALLGCCGRARLAREPRPYLVGLEDADRPTSQEDWREVVAKTSKGKD